MANIFRILHTLISKNTFSFKIRDSCKICPRATHFCMMAFEEVNVLSGHSKAVVSCKICPGENSQLVASASADASAKIWCMDDGQCRATLIGHKEGICDLAWTATGSYICTASDDHTLKLWVGQCHVTSPSCTWTMSDWWTSYRRTLRRGSVSRPCMAIPTMYSAATSTLKVTSWPPDHSTRLCVFGM